MKSLRKFNFFRHNKHPKEDKENHHDEPSQVRFPDHNQDPIQFQPQRKILKRRTSLDNFEKINPYDSAKAKPRTNRPVQSCVGKVTGNEYASSSDDDVSTLVSVRTGYQKPRKCIPLQLQQTNYKKRQNVYGDIQTSSEYGSGDPSPTHKHVAFNYDIEYSHGSDYWKNKYRHYKDLCKKISAENSKLRDQNRFYQHQFEVSEERKEEVKILRKQNHELQSQIHLLNTKLHAYERNQQHYMPHIPSAYPMLPPMLPHIPFNNQHQLQQHGGAGEKLASNSRIPEFAAESLLSHGNNNGNIFVEEDETKNFRNDIDRSSSDDQFAINNSLFTDSTDSNGPERSRGDAKIEVSPLRHDRSSSLTILQDDGYSSHGTTQSNQTLTTITAENDELKVLTDTECLKTPVKQGRPIPRRRVRFLSN